MPAPSNPKDAQRRNPELGADLVGSVWCILLAAGSGQRFGSLKQFDPLGDGRVIDYAAVTAAAVCDGVVAVLPADSLATENGVVPAASMVVAGGATRSESVRAGLMAVPTEAVVILVHDAARPLATAELFTRVIETVRTGEAAVVPAIRVVDTIRSVEAGSSGSGSSGAGSSVIDRDLLRAVQTPQGFRADLLRQAYVGSKEATDDAALVEALGYQITLVDGERTNLKLTEFSDRVLAEALLSSVRPSL
ncbi:MAG: 2-C-methyl-D-erythritol 4-phosphate cytidylyltransferase [Microthrixaceae bacterium]